MSKNSLFKITTLVLFFIGNTVFGQVHTKSKDTLNKKVLKTQFNDKQMKHDGFDIGHVKYQPESNCDYIIINKDTRVKLDPINIGDKSFISLKNDIQSIYYKYRPLRRMNRCPEAIPILLVTVKKRDSL